MSLYEIPKTIIKEVVMLGYAMIIINNMVCYYYRDEWMLD